MLAITMVSKIISVIQTIGLTDKTTKQLNKFQVTLLKDDKILIWLNPSQCCTVLHTETIENIVIKGENTVPVYFFSFQRQKSSFQIKLICHFRVLFFGQSMVLLFSNIYPLPK